ncbi:MAG: hypothetical protein Q9187_001190 [Circinaria calcarea]
MNDRTFILFLNMYKAYIATELAREPDVFEVPKVTRSKDSLIEDALTRGEDDTIAADEWNFPNRYAGTGNDQQLIVHEPITKTWCPPRAEKFVKKVFTVQLMRDVENLTGCRVELSETSGQLIVRGELMDNVDNAIKKLKAIDKTHTERELEAERGIANFYVHEDELNYHLMLMAATQLKDRRLVPIFRLQPPRYFAVTMMRWNSDTEVYEPTLRNLEPLQTVPERPRLWNSYVYNSYGDEVNNPARWAQQPIIPSTSNREGPIHPILPHEKFTAVAKWNDEASTAKSNAFKMATEDDENRQLASGSRRGILPASERASCAEQYKKTERIALNKEHMAAFTGPITDTSVMLSKASKFHAATPPITATPSSIGPVATYAALQIASSETPQEMRPPPIRGPIMPKKPNPPATPNQEAGIPDRNNPTETTSSMAWSTNIVRGEETGDLLGIGQSQSTPKDGNQKANRFNENKQLETEEDTRRYRRNKSLKKSPGNAGLRNDAPVIAKIEKSAMSILYLIRSVTGLIRLKVPLGHVYVEGRRVSREYKRHPFPASEWSSVFQPHQRMGHVSTIFSNLLTTSWIDAEYILDLKLARSQRMFSESSTKSSVIYEIKCSSSRSGVEAVLELDENGVHTIRNTPELIGANNWHFLRRVWDARLEITGTTPIEKELQHDFKAIIDHLYIGAGKDLPELYISTTASNVEIQSVTVKRQTQHPCYQYPDLLLQLTEVQDLIIQKNSPGRYRAIGRDPNQMVAEDNRLWWEAAIVSTVAQSILKENVDLEVGEEATWEPQTFVEDGIIRNMFNLAKEVVTRIDNVGFSTPAIAVAGEWDATKASRPSRTTSAELDDGPFW